MCREDLSVQPTAWFQFWHKRRPDSSSSLPSSSRVDTIFCLPFQMVVARQKRTECGLWLRQTGHAGSVVSGPGLDLRNRLEVARSIGDLDLEDLCLSGPQSRRRLLPLSLSLNCGSAMFLREKVTICGCHPELSRPQQRGAKRRGSMSGVSQGESGVA